MKAPYKSLFSNDTTNIEQNTSPYNNIRWLKNGPPKPFTPQMLQATVDETTGIGIDAHMLQPGVGWVPWWKSKRYPFTEHMKFMKQRYGKEPKESGFAAYMASGGDIVQVFVDRCREKKIAPIISFRLNDGHGHESAHLPPEQIKSWCWHVLTPWHIDHPEWRIGNNLSSWDDRVLNWAFPEVRNHKFAYIREIIEQYDIDGFELDFMRHSCFFRENETPIPERRKIMREFVADVRALLDRTAKPGQHRWLGVRIPCRLDRLDRLGVNVKEFAAAGVDMFNLGNGFFVEQQSDLAEVVRQVPDASVYNEGTYCASLGRSLGGYDQACRRMTDEMFYTLGHLTYSRGGAGLSTFNFVYYRQHHDNDAMGPWAEPPFHIFKGLADPAFCAAQPQHYFVPLLHGGRGLPWEIRPGAEYSTELDLAPPTGGWKKAGRLRIQADSDLTGARWEAIVNGKTLSATSNVTELYSSPFENCLGVPANYKAWIVPPDLLRDGMNSVKVKFISGVKPVQLAFLDLSAS